MSDIPLKQIVIKSGYSRSFRMLYKHICISYYFLYWGFIVHFDNLSIRNPLCIIYVCMYFSNNAILTLFSCFSMSLVSYLNSNDTYINFLIVMCVLGNKCDLAEQRQVPLEEGVQFAASIGALFFETSALTNDG